MDHIHITQITNPMSLLDKIGFIDHGQGYYGWMTALHSAMIQSRRI